MSESAVALLLGTVLAVGALAFVLYPLFFGSRGEARAAVPAAPAPAEEGAVQALREIEFDRATGKLSDSDYSELKLAYSARAIREMREAGGGVAAESPAAEPDPIEARVRAYRQSRRECVSCGLRPEPDAIYCSACGGYLAQSCPVCSARVKEAAASHCSSCGARLSPV